jgi:hypothetical protein
VSDNIEVALSQERIVINPGEKAEVAVNIRNTSEIVEVFSIEVEGIESSWYSTSISSVSLFPGDKETISISFTPPLSSSSGAGSYTATVKVSSRRDPTITSTVDLLLELGKISSYELGLTPQKVRGGKGSFEVIINNTGNLTNTYKLEASDPEAMCNYEFKSDTVVVEAGQTSKVPITVTPKKRPLTGATKFCTFTVTVTPIASEVKSVQGQLECPARFPRWAPVALVACIAVIVLVVVLVVVLGGGDGGNGVEVLDTKHESFKLSPNEYQMYEVKCQDLGDIQADVEWTGAADRLSLVLFGPIEAQPALDRDEDVSPLGITYAIKVDDINAGDIWRIYVANLSDTGDAQVTLDMTYES